MPNQNCPLESASVFMQNTTIGTTTDASGNFKLALPDGGYDLVITSTSYKTTVIRISTNDVSKKNVVVELKRIEKELAAIIITSGKAEKNGWENYGDFFLANFIGETPNSKLCTVKNKEVLKFYFLKERNCLKITATDPLEIRNDALGYTIKYSIDSFVYDYNKLETTFTGSPFFEEITPTDSVQKKKWTANRLRAYKGSILHFMRSMYYQQLKTDGFEVKAFKKGKLEERAIPIVNVYESLNYNKNDSLQIVQILPKYYVLELSYTKGKPEYEYMNRYPQGYTKFQISALTFTPDKVITIEPNGFFYSQYDMIKSNYLAWKRMADMLPYDFKP
ncbi:MAG: carboxypeptidase-like regulatory domain-containing protein [Ferruginibacter sp.]